MRGIRSKSIQLKPTNNCIESSNKTLNKSNVGQELQLQNGQTPNARVQQIRLNKTKKWAEQQKGIDKYQQLEPQFDYKIQEKTNDKLTKTSIRVSNLKSRKQQQQMSKNNNFNVKKQGNKQINQQKINIIRLKFKDVAIEIKKHFQLVISNQQIIINVQDALQKLLYQAKSKQSQVKIIGLQNSQEEHLQQSQMPYLPSLNTIYNPSNRVNIRPRGKQIPDDQYQLLASLILNKKDEEEQQNMIQFGQASEIKSKIKEEKQLVQNNHKQSVTVARIRGQSVSQKSKDIANTNQQAQGQSCIRFSQELQISSNIDKGSDKQDWTHRGINKSQGLQEKPLQKDQQNEQLSNSLTSRARIRVCSKINYEQKLTDTNQSFQDIKFCEKSMRGSTKMKVDKIKQLNLKIDRYNEQLLTYQYYKKNLSQYQFNEVEIKKKIEEVSDEITVITLERSVLRSELAKQKNIN